MLATRRAIILGSAVSLTLLVGCTKPATSRVAPAVPKQPVEVATIVQRDLVESLSLVGSLVPNESAQIRAEISGQVRAVLFAEGGLVKKGQVLLQIDDAELRAQLAQAEARFHLNELSLKRSEDLTESRSMSQAEADRVRSEFAASEAEVQLLRIRLGKMALKAPFDGVVGARTISAGDYITAATIVTTINDLSRLKIDFQVPERYTSKIKPSTTFAVRVQSPAGEARADGTVYFISSVIERTTRSSQVKGYVTGAPVSFQPGMFAGIELVLEVHRRILTVPEGAILTTPRGAQVITVVEQKGEKVAAFVPVQLGLREKGLVEVRAISPAVLKDKQVIVASGVGALILYPGIKLEPRPLRAEFRIED